MAESQIHRVGTVSEHAGRAAGYADQATDAARDYATQVADRVAAVAKEAYDDPQRFMRETQDDITRRAQQNPLQTLAVAAGIGFVIGAIWKR